VFEKSGHVVSGNFGKMKIFSALGEGIERGGIGNPDMSTGDE